MQDGTKSPQPTFDDLLTEAAAMPGVADLMALYQQQAAIVAMVQAYMMPSKPQIVLSAGTGTQGITG